MNILILVLLGLATGLLISKSRYSKKWDVAIGILGALAVNSFVTMTDIAYSAYAFLIIMIGAAAVVHLGRVLQVFPQN